MSSRRNFVRQLALLSGAAFVASKASAGFVASLANASGTAARDALAHANFAALEGASFRVEGAGISARQSWRLSEVARYERGPQVENFSLRFTGDAAVALPEGVYRLSNPQLGEVELFVVASPVANGTIGYSAVINRLV